MVLRIRNNKKEIKTERYVVITILVVVVLALLNGLVIPQQFQ